MESDNLDGWGLCDSREIEVSAEQGSRRQIEIRKKYTKKIGDDWYYKNVFEAIPLVRREYKDIDGKFDSFFEWVKEE